MQETVEPAELVKYLTERNTIPKDILETMHIQIIIGQFVGTQVSVDTENATFPAWLFFIKQTPLCLPLPRPGYVQGTENSFTFKK